MSVDQKKLVEQIFKATSAKTKQGQFVPATKAAAACKASCGGNCAG